MASTSMPNDAYQCKWCNRSFTRERTLSNHLCERKRRWMVSGEAPSRIAFQVWIDFMKHVSPQTKRQRTMEDFIRSPDYASFLKFALYLIDLRPIESDSFIKWLFKMNVRIGDWCKAGTYAIYVQELSKRETVERAVERSLLTIKEWSSENCVDWTEFFARVPTVVAVNMIANGRLSPWILYSVKKAQQMLERMEPQQIDTVARSIDIEWWKKKIAKSQEETQWIAELL